MSLERITDRARTLGIVGEKLLELLDLGWANVVGALPYSDCISAIYKPFWGSVRPSPLRRAAGAFLVPEFPVQVYLDEASLLHFVDNFLEGEPSYGSAPVFKLACRAHWTVRMFPLKSHPAASNKVNVYLDEVCRSLYRESPALYSLAESVLYWLSIRNTTKEKKILKSKFRKKIAQTVIYNDQATAIVMYGYVLTNLGVPSGFWAAAQLALQPDVGKALTTFIKSIGANATRLGAALTECNALLGRNVGPIDLYQEALYRTLPVVDDQTANLDNDALRAAIRDVLTDEIRRVDGSTRIEFESLADNWSSRWQWAANGANSGQTRATYPATVPQPPGMAREHRRAWLERISEDPRPDWLGDTYVSVSEKLEAGKTRAIFACDTVNYLAFEHLMGPVEKRWRHNRVILDPGSGGHAGMAYRVRAAKKRAGISMMLDYDDFNSQHTNDSMRMLIEETVAITGYPPELARPLLASFDRTYIYTAGQCLGKSRGTLMSGHRCTTYINSVLNAAYLRVVLGRDLYEQTAALHVGDDVYMGVRTYAAAEQVQKSLKNSRLRMNPMKQSVGHVSMEFLRCASSERSTRGYIARSISAIVSGNWISEARLSPRESLITMITSARTLVNRGDATRLPLLLLDSCVRMTGLEREDHVKLQELLLGTLALDNGPMFAVGGRYRRVRLKVEITHTDQFGLTPLPHLAASDYLSNHSSELEVSMLNEAGVSVTSAMEEASFRKSLPGRYTSFERISLGPVETSESRGTACIENLLSSRVPVGVLSKYPLLVLARYRLPEYVVKTAVRLAGGNPNALDLEMEAWGEYSHGCMIASPMSYADAAMFGRRTWCSVLTSTFPVYV